MARHAYRVRVRSCVDDHVLRTVTERVARLMCAEDSEGNELEGSEKEAFRLNLKKHRLTDIRLKSPERETRFAATTITLGEIERSGLQDVFRVLDKDQSIASMVSAEEKVKLWPEISDSNCSTISAGVAIGSFCPVFDHPALSYEPRGFAQ